MEETELIRLARSGDRDAFSALMERYEKRVYHQALRLLNHPEDAADVTQEVFFKAWRGLPRFQGESAFSTWLYRLTDNAAIDLLRREKKRRGDLSLDDPDSLALPAGPVLTPQQALEAGELQKAVERGLACLSEEHRRVLVLRELNGLSYEQIGGLLDLPAGTVKSRIARARLALAKILRDGGNFSAAPPSKRI